MLRALFSRCAIACALLAAPAALAQSATPTFEIIPVSRAQHLVQNKRVHILDTRPVAKYLAGHIDNAVHIEDECLRESVSGLPARYLAECDLGRVFERAGVRADVPVLVYSDAEDPLAATMTAYALLKAGHSDVLLLDGGFETWRGNNPVTQTYATFTTTPWTAQPDTTHTADLARVKQMADTNEGALIDARPAKLFRGEGKPWPRNGHIPHAISLDWKSLVRADNEALFKPRKEIEALLKDAGLDARTPTVVYCGTGREATLLYLYLRGVLEWPNVKLFEGSWTQWSADPTLPIATGDGPEIFTATDNTITVSAQPTEQMLRALAEQGCTLVINCRTAAEMSSVPFNEASLAKKLGMTYVEIPLGGNEGYDPADVTKLSDTLKAHPGAKTLLHCASGGRSTQLYLAHLATNEGMTIAQAQGRARAAGMLTPTSLERLLNTTLESQPANE